MNTPGFVVGVDGGGTKTVGELADLNGDAVATHAVGATNPNVVTPEESSRILCTLIRQLCTQRSCRPGHLRGITLGLAGASGESLQKEIREKITRGLHEAGMPDPPVQVATDIRVALEGAFGGRAGIAVVAGTGSSIMYKTKEGAVGLLGGWGRVLGDEGSGFFIGLEALKAVTRDYDGLAKADGLRKALATRFGLDSRYRIIEAVYRQKFPVPSLAPLVFDLARQGEKTSGEILKRAATLLADQVETAMLRMEEEGSVGIVLYGGLVEHDTPYKDIFIGELTSRFPRVRIQPPLFSAAQGAVLMALRLVREDRKT
jgi:N-acetylglucosamine kinase-like BadF-type ATPase